MGTLSEIESAADALPRSEQERLYRHLAAKLQLAPASREKPAAAVPEAVVWPDYEMRLRAIYGDKAMPSMVLAERETAAW
jgi:hypothetical protein